MPFTRLATAVGLSEAAVRQRVQRLLDGVEYLVVTAGAFDLLCEAVVADDTALLSLTNELRAIDGVAATET